LPGYEVTNWYGIVVPRGTPREAILRIRDEVAKAVKAPDMRDKMIREGMEPIGSTPEEFGAFMKVETTKWAKVIKDSGMKID
jgi:tripartite-type tricarboxylate transporter receptor subunit TctC